MKTYLDTYFDYVSRTPVLIASFVASMLFIIVIFPSLAVNIESLDVRMSGYTFADVMAAMEGYGEVGRGRYALISFSLDTLFPICYVSFYAGAIYRFVPHERLRLLAYLPLIGGVFDLGENAQIITMLLQYPDISMMLSEWANRFTLIKFGFSRTSMVLAFAALAWAAVSMAYQRLRQKA
jgi:hypothetical protein